MRLLRWIGIITLLTACGIGPTQPAVFANDDLVLPDDLDEIIQVVDPPDEPGAVAANLQRIFAHGQSLGNRADVFSKVGDSITVSPLFLTTIGRGSYDLNDHSYLADLIDYYSATDARDGDSFQNPSLAAAEGWAAWGVLYSAFSPGPPCRANETPLRCEYRVVQPAVALIMFGTNDVGYRTPEQYRADLETILTISEEMGVIPILSTFPERPEISAQVAHFNQIVRDLAQEHLLPVWDYHAALQTVPRYGLGRDNLHPSSPPTGYESLADFSPANLQYGYVVRNLTALQALYQVQQLLALEISD